MTPIQLPEVPARYDTAHSENTGETLAVYTAAQLREYATEAVMAERERVASLADRWDLDARRIANGPMFDSASEYAISGTYTECARDLRTLLTPSEPNSDR